MEKIGVQTINAETTTPEEAEIYNRSRMMEMLVNRLFNTEMEVNDTTRIFSLQEEISLLATMLTIRLIYVGITPEQVCEHMTERYRLIEKDLKASMKATHAPSQVVQ
jgi:hypothetical protein